MGARPPLLSVAVVALFALSALLAGAQNEAPTMRGGSEAFVDDASAKLMSMRSVYGNESYKGDDRFNTRNANDFQNQTRVWNAALGLRLSLQVLLTKPGTEEELPQTEGEFEIEPYIDASSGRLWGWATGSRSVDASAVPPVVATRNYAIHFDLDGTPPQASGTTFPPLPPGFHVVHLDIYHAARPGETRIKAAQAEFPFTLTGTQVATPFALQRVPEEVFRTFSDVSPGPTAWMPFAPVAPGSSLSDLTFRFGPQAANRTVVVKLYWPDRVVPKGIDQPTVPDPLSGTPIGGVVGDATGLDEASTTMVEQELLNRTADANGDLRIDSLTIQGEGERLAVLGAYLAADEPQGHLAGAASFVIPIAPSNFQSRAINLVSRVPSVGGAPTAEIEALYRDAEGGAGGTAGGPAGDLFALAERGGTTHVLAKVGLGAPDSNNFVRGYVPVLQLSGDEITGYRLLAMAYGDGDAFHGLATSQRGFLVRADELRAVQGRPHNVQLTVTSLSTDFDNEPSEDYDMVVRLNVSNLPQGTPWESNVTLPEAGSWTVPIPFQADATGTFSLRLTATSGDITQEVPLAVQVISQKDHDRENRKWYQIPGTGLLATLAALGAALAASRRRTG